MGYPVFDLDQLKTGVKGYISRLEDAIIRTLETYGISTDRLPGATGVWIDPGIAREVSRKICAIGVKVSRGITMHGFALNVNTNLSYFNHINPCGFTDKGVTSMEKELGHQARFGRSKGQTARKYCFRLWFHPDLNESPLMEVIASFFGWLPESLHSGAFGITFTFSFRFRVTGSPSR